MNCMMAMRSCGAVLVALVLTTASAQAQERDRHGGERGGERGRVERFDARYSHNRYYSDRGMVVRAVPGSPYIVERGGGRFVYSAGVWYRPYGPSFVVVAAPVGVFVPLLPPYYTTVWVGGFPYYYANDTYYAWRADQNAYEVVDPMSDPGVASTQPPPSDELFIYPQSGQSPEQQANDKYECHKWSSTQTGFDPTQSAGGVPPEQAVARRADYQRALRACLEGRGYSVR